MQLKDTKVNARGVLPRVKLLVFVIPLPSSALGGVTSTYHLCLGIDLTWPFLRKDQRLSDLEVMMLTTSKRDEHPSLFLLDSQGSRSSV